MLLELEFYTTEGCHLCEEAEVLLQQLLARYPNQLQVEVIDIVESEELIQQYGERIPILKIAGDNSDLGWPFDFTSMETYINKQ